MAGLPGAAALAGTPFRRTAPVVLDLAPLRRHGHLSRSCRLPIPVLRVSGTPQRSEARPRAERRAPRRAAVVCALSYLNTAPLPRRRGASGAAQRPTFRSPSRGAETVCKAAALRASGARRPRTPRAGRGRGGRSAPTAPPRPGPEGASGLRSHAPEVTSARPADPAQRRSAPSPKASAPPPTPQPWRQPR